MAVIGVAFFMASGLVLAQADKMPKPGPEQKNIGYFAGTWKNEGEMKPSPFGPGGKMSGTDTCTWFAGGFHLVCKSEGKGPMGPVKGMGVIGYNSEDKVYTYYGMDSTSMGGLSKGTKDGNTWTFTSEDKMGGKLIKSRYTIVEDSPTNYNFKWEVSEDGSTWNAVMMGKETKVTKAAATK
jgi:hypothetical protein